MPDGADIRCGPGETLQQAIDRETPSCISAMLELYSPQTAETAATTSTYVSAIVKPTEVMMHTLDMDDESDNVDEEVDEDFSNLMVAELQVLAQSLNDQVKQNARSAPTGPRVVL